MDSDLDSDEVLVTAQNLLSRFLYPNPVCLLTSRDDESSVNVMTISWLTPINNDVSSEVPIFSGVRLTQSPLVG
jgi:hypothetical protein